MILTDDELRPILTEVHASRGWFYKDGAGYEAAAELGYLHLVTPGSGPMDEYYQLTEKGRDHLGLPPLKSSRAMEIAVLLPFILFIGVPFCFAIFA